MLDYHKANNADVTIAAMPVPMERGQPFRNPDYGRVQPNHGIRGKACKSEKQPGIHGNLYL